MELRHLRYFLAVASHQNVRAASEELHVSQPAVSRQIQDLEDELGIQLFERLPRGIRLSRAGEAFREDISRVMAALGVACERAQRVSRGEIGELRIGYVEVAGWEGIVPDTFHAFRESAPECRLELTPTGTPDQLAMIRAGTLDGGFIYQFDPLPPDLAALHLGEHGVLLAMPSRWAQRPDGPVKLSDLTGERFIFFHRNAYPAYFDRLLTACALAGLVPHIVQEGRNEAAVLSLVSAGIGMAIVNDRNRFRPPAQVEFRELEDLQIGLPLRFVYRRERSNPALETIIACLESGRSTAPTQRNR